MRGRLNSFQRTMLQWDDLHPYNAVHVLILDGPLDPPRLRAAIGSVLERWGVGGLRMDRNAGTFDYGAGVPPGDIELSQGGPGQASFAELAPLVERELNRRFEATETFAPFRFFAVTEPARFALGLVYFHAIADAEAIVRLLEAVAATYAGSADEGGGHQPPNLYPPLADRFMLCRPQTLARVLTTLPRQVRNLRQSSRPAFRDPADGRNGFTLFAIEGEGLNLLLTTARELDVTVHDLLLALLLKSLSPLAARRLSRARRRRISVGSIVNVRRDLTAGCREAFGLFLGSFVIGHEVPDGLPVAALAREIREETRRIKAGRLYLGTPAQLGLARLALSFFSTPRRQKFYQKHHPLWAGITNMNLSTTWRTQTTRPLDYLRAVSTGPVTPLVLSATTVGDRLNVGLSYRTTVYSAEDVARLRGAFLGALDELRVPK